MDEGIIDMSTGFVRALSQDNGSSTSGEELLLLGMVKRAILDLESTAHRKDARHWLLRKGSNRQTIRFDYIVEHFGWDLRKVRKALRKK